MDDSEFVRELFTLLHQGHIEAAEARFQEYLTRRIKVGSADLVATVWAKAVADKRREVAAQQAAAAQKAQAKGRWIRKG